jgi:pyrroline-5-carboxylate reductase
LAHAAEPNDKTLGYNASMLSPKISIGFIGAGNMASALIEGLLATGVQPARLWASDPSQDKLELLAAKGINTAHGNLAVLTHCDVVVLAVKPQVMATVVAALQTALVQKPVLLVSIAAGIPLNRLSEWTHPTQAIVRCMPNTPALVQAGASALFANPHVSDEQKQTTAAILESVGLVSWLDNEAQMDAVTALSGSGPAYFFLMLEALQAAGTELGLSADVARMLAQQTAYGAAKLALASDVDVAELRRRVTSPGGTTEAAIKQFESEHFREMVRRALDKAAARSAELAKIS